MKKKTYSILYLRRGQWDFVNDEHNKRRVFNSVTEAKQHIDELRKEGTHPINLVHHAVIYGFDGCLMEGEGIRY